MARLKGYAMNDHLTRYRLPNGWFIDRDELVSMRYHGYKYSLWEPGASKPTWPGASGCAAFRGGHSTLAGALDLVPAA